MIMVRSFLVCIKGVKSHDTFWEQLAIGRILKFLTSKGGTSIRTSILHGTPPKTNMEPENHPIEIRKIIWSKPPFFGSMLIFRGVDHVDLRISLAEKLDSQKSHPLETPPTCCQLTHHNTHGSKVLFDSFNFITASTQPQKIKKWVLPLQKKTSWNPFIFSFMNFSHPKHLRTWLEIRYNRCIINPPQPKRWKPPTSTATRKQDLMIRRKALRRLGGAGLQIFALKGRELRHRHWTKIPRWWNFRSTSHCVFFWSICEVVKTTSQTLCRLVGIMCTYAYLYIISRCYRESFMIIPMIYYHQTSVVFFAAHIIGHPELLN